jgi:hypothetical protein
LAAFLIVDVTEVNDEPTYAKYRQGVPSTLAVQGGHTWFVADRLRRLREIGDLIGSSSFAFTLSRLHATGGEIQPILN